MTVHRQLIFGMLLLSGCTGLTEATQQLEVTVTASRSSVAATRPIEITVTATNRNSQAAEVIANSCPEAYRVISADGVTVAPGAALCTAMALQRRLQPGESMVFSYTWSGTTRNAIDGPPVPLPAGSYRVQGFVETRDGEARSNLLDVQVQP
jgi:hypothetical protein